MNPDDSKPDRTEVHRGYDLESGVLQRVRDWTDVFPWVRLGRTMRVAVSPPLLMMTAATYSVWLIGVSVVTAIALPTDLNQLGRQHVFFAAWSCFTWAPVALALSRQGGLLTAGRPLARQREIQRLCWQRTPVAWFTAVVPTACVTAIASLTLLAGWAARLVGDVFVIEALLALFVFATAIPCGILWFGSAFAIPLGWAALANESDPDALDSLSRGYESLYRRPLRLTLYLLAAAVIVTVVYGIATGVSSAASLVASITLQISGCSPNVMRITNSLLSHLPVIVSAAQMWSLIGGIYLLLRYDTGGQEVEDIWQPPSRPETPLPNIPIPAQ